MIPPLFAHQKKDIEFMKTVPTVFDNSDPGTGKTRKCLELLRHDPFGSRTLVIAPKSILEPAWGNDIKKFLPEFSYAIASAPKREQAFKSDARIVITNHDAATWLLEHRELLVGFHRLIVDESTAFKNREAKRSQAIATLAWMFPTRVLLTGTPTPNGILDLWHQVFILDQGHRLGTQYFKFRAATCEPVARGMFTEWFEKPGAADAVSALIQDITIRNKMEECIDIPENRTYSIDFELSKAHRKIYEQVADFALLELENEEPALLKTQSLATKLLQIASGAVYTGDQYAKVASERYELILDLIEARPQCVCAFNWRHQREELTALAAKRKIPYAVIDGSTRGEDRTQAVNDFQAGKLRVIFAHPQSAGHGLTLTAGVATIWSSPTYNLEQFEQFNRRIYRAGQTKKTETILIEARDTIERKVFEALQNKSTRMNDLLELLKT